jgi:hypothetical protein
MKMYRHGLFLAAATLGLSAAEASTGRLMRSPDVHPPKKKLTGAAKAAAAKKEAAAKLAAERAAPEAPRRSAANTGAIATTVATIPRSPLADEANKVPAIDENGKTWPSWRYGPDGDARIFQNAAEVPKGWKEHPGAFEAAEPILDL